jgi:hypothetical protein
MEDPGVWFPCQWAISIGFLAFQRHQWHLRRMKFFTRVFILPICLLSGLKGMAQAPGGVSGNLEFWVKAGTGASGSLWQDQSGNGNNATQATAADQPVVTANQINFNPAQVFNGTSDFMNIAGSLGLGGTGNFEIYCVVQQSGSGGQVFLGSQTAAANDIQLATFTGSPTQVNYWGTGTVLIGTTNLAAGTAYISGYEKAGTGANQSTIYIDGNVDNTGTISQSMGAGNRVIGSSSIGGGTQSFFTSGDIAEIVVYNAALSAANRSMLQSYLSFKYGFPPPTGAGFVASTGSAFWTYNATYANDVFGIGRDDGSGLSLSSSNSINTGSGNGTGQSGKGNIVLSNPSALNNLDFIVVGDNGGSLAEQTTGLPAGTAAGVERVGRQWKVNHTNAVGTTVTLTFNTTGLTTGSGVTDFSLLIDADGTGNFATAPITSIAASSYSGNIATFTNVSLPNNAVFTFIVKDAILLPLNFLSFTARLGANQQVNLEWQISDETNVSHFVVERSTDGSSFTPIGEVNFGSADNYAFTDNNAVAGNNYYRIESVDNDGYTQYSKVDEITVPEPTLQVKLLNNQPGYEDPVLMVSAGTAVTLSIQLLTSDGSVVSRMQKSFAAGQTRQTISTTGLARGVYIIEVSGSGYGKNFLIIR